MTNPPKPSTPIKNFLLGAFMMASLPTAIDFYEYFYRLGQGNTQQVRYTQTSYHAAKPDCADAVDVVTCMESQLAQKSEKGVKR